MRLFNLSIGALLLTSACTSPDISNETKNLATAITAISTDVSAVLDPALVAGANARRNAAIRAGRPYYVELERANTYCDPETFMALLDDRNFLSEHSGFPLCELRILGEDDRSLTTAEYAELVRGLLVEYTSNLSLLANSKSATDIQTSTANLIAKIQTFDQARGNTTSGSGWVFSHSKAVSGLAGFISAQRRAHFIRSTLTHAQEPIKFAAGQLIHYLLDPDAINRDPIVKAWSDLEIAQGRHHAAPTSIEFAQQLESAHEAYEKARAKSPAIKLILFVRAHDALVNRVSGPPTAEEATALLNDINALIDLIEA